jgi:hypothetical protein
MKHVHRRSTLHRYLIGVAFTLVSLAALLAITTNDADAYTSAEGGDHRPCVTRAELNSVRHGMSRADVADLFDTPGIYYFIAGSEGGTEYWRLYKPCPGTGRQSYAVWFDNYSYGGRSTLRAWDWWRTTNPDLRWDALN